MDYSVTFHGQDLVGRTIPSGGVGLLDREGRLSKEGGEVGSKTTTTNRTSCAKVEVWMIEVVRVEGSEKNVC